MRKLLILLLSVTLLSACGIVEHIAGVGFDNGQFEKARQAKILELQLKSAQALEKRLEAGSGISDYDLTVVLDEKFMNNLLDNYESATGMLDDATDYVIKGVEAKLVNGSAIASFELLAHNETHNIDVNLLLDCLIMIETKGKDLLLKVEPFNISPILTTRGIYSSAEELIKKLIKLNLANLNKSLPPLKIPLNIENEIQIAGSKTDVKSNINLTIINPDRNVKFILKINDILFFNEKILIGLNLDKIEVKS
ncbi:MAG: hypothetical protein V1779_16820 [bacterium]